MTLWEADLLRDNMGTDTRYRSWLLHLGELCLREPHAASQHPMQVDQMWPVQQYSAAVELHHGYKPGKAATQDVKSSTTEFSDMLTK